MTTEMRRIWFSSIAIVTAGEKVYILDLPAVRTMGFWVSIWADPPYGWTIQQYSLLMNSGAFAVLDSKGDLICRSLLCAIPLQAHPDMGCALAPKQKIFSVAPNRRARQFLKGDTVKLEFRPEDRGENWDLGTAKIKVRLGGECEEESI